MKKLNSFILVMLILNAIIIFYNNFFFALLDGYLNNFEEGWFVNTLYLSLIAYSLVVPLSLLTRKGVILLNNKYDINENKLKLLKLMALILNIVVVVTIMMIFTTGFNSPEFKKNYFIVVGLAIINGIIISSLLTKRISNYVECKTCK